MTSALRRTIASAFAIACTAASVASAQSRIPDRYADSTFWRFTVDFSENGGDFRSDNLLSNERSFQWVTGGLAALRREGGVYLGVAPEQNFTFLAALKPRVAFIIDIRRGNLLELLMYKALFETSANRVDFAYRLFGRRRPVSVTNMVGVSQLMSAVAGAPVDSTYSRAILAELKAHLTGKHRFPLSKQDLDYIDYVYTAFADIGPGLRYDTRGNQFRSGGMRLPSYAELMTATDSTGAHKSYLASDEAWNTIKEMQERNAIVPFTGDFAGKKALRAFGDYVRSQGATIQAIYVSNVEQYLFQSPDNWKKYYDNVAMLPIDANTVFIRSASNGVGPFGLPPRAQSGRQNELLCPVQQLLDAFKAGKITAYGEIFALCR